LGQKSLGVYYFVPCTAVTFPVSIKGKGSVGRAEFCGEQ